jgi:hypothetical protein
MMAYTELVPQRSPFISSQEGGGPMVWKRVFHGVSRGVNPHCAQVIHSPVRLRKPLIKARGSYVVDWMLLGYKSLISNEKQIFKKCARF